MIIRNPKILALDEATAALDNESQKLVQSALDALHVTQPRTMLTVAHRLLTIKDCEYHCRVDARVNISVFAHSLLD